MSIVDGWTYAPLERSTPGPNVSTTAAATTPQTKATAPSTTALATSTRARAGVALTVVWISPRRYSAVTNMVATTTTRISPANVPTRVWVSEVPTPAAPE